MAKKIKKHWDLVLISGIGLTLAIAGILAISGMIALPNPAEAATATVGVTATVQEWLTFSVNPTSVTLTPDLVDTAGNTAVGSSTAVTLTLGTNSPDGWSIDARGATAAATCAQGGLVSGSYEICQPSATSTLAAGTDGYGANATDTLTGVTIAANYAYWGTNTVGELNDTDSDFASKTSSNASSDVASMKVLTASDALQEPGSYTDTITLTAIASL